MSTQPVLQWICYPRSRPAPPLAARVIEAFELVLPKIASDLQDDLESNDVLGHVAPHLRAAGFRVESGKKKFEKISVPVLLGERGSLDKTFDADAYHPGAGPGGNDGFVVEVEAGRATINNQFLKDLFQACMMQDVAHLAIAVRQTYSKGGRSSKDYDLVRRFFETLYASDRLKLPLCAVLIIGY